MVLHAFAPVAPARTSFRFHRHSHLPLRPRRAQRVVAMRSVRTMPEVVRDAQTVYGADKPPWCQPWTIVGTGSGVIGGSWALFHDGVAAVLAVGVTAAIFLWWYVFLVVYPASEVESIEQRR